MALLVFVRDKTQAGVTNPWGVPHKYIKCPGYLSLPPISKIQLIFFNYAKMLYIICKDLRALHCFHNFILSFNLVYFMAILRNFW